MNIKIDTFFNIFLAIVVNQNKDDIQTALKSWNDEGGSGYEDDEQGKDKQTRDTQINKTNTQTNKQTHKSNKKYHLRWG